MLSSKKHNIFSLMIILAGSGNGPLNHHNFILAENSSVVSQSPKNQELDAAHKSIIDLSKTFDFDVVSYFTTSGKVFNNVLANSASTRLRNYAEKGLPSLEEDFEECERIYTQNLANQSKEDLDNIDNSSAYIYKLSIIVNELEKKNLLEEFSKKYSASYESSNNVQLQHIGAVIKALTDGSINKSSFKLSNKFLKEISFNIDAKTLRYKDVLKNISNLTQIQNALNSELKSYFIVDPKVPAQALIDKVNKVMFKRDASDPRKYYLNTKPADWVLENNSSDKDFKVVMTSFLIDSISTSLELSSISSFEDIKDLQKSLAHKPTINLLMLFTRSAFRTINLLKEAKEDVEYVTKSSAASLSVVKKINLKPTKI